jgi:hypothetical protein
MPMIKRALSDVFFLTIPSQHVARFGLSRKAVVKKICNARRSSQRFCEKLDGSELAWKVSE